MLLEKTNRLVRFLLLIGVFSWHYCKCENVGGGKRSSLTSIKQLRQLLKPKNSELGFCNFEDLQKCDWQWEEDVGLKKVTGPSSEERGPKTDASNRIRGNYFRNFFQLVISSKIK